MTLDDTIIAAHETGDGSALAGLYQQAARVKLSDGDREASLFFLCQAYVFALENDHPSLNAIHAVLREAGREA